MSGLRRAAAAFLLVVSVLVGRAAAADARESRMSLDDDTQLLLRINAAGTALECAAGAPVKVTGGTVVPDPSFGHVLRLAGDGETFLTVQDGGRFQFTKGFTFEAWLNLKDAQKSAPGNVPSSPPCGSASTRRWRR